MTQKEIVDLVNKSKSEHSEQLSIEKAKAIKEKDMLTIRHQLARLGLRDLREDLQIVFKDAHNVEEFQIAFRENPASSDGIYFFERYDINGTHSFYIDIRNGCDAGSLRVYSSCEPNFRVFYGVEVYGRPFANNSPIHGLLEQLARDEIDEKLMLIIDKNEIVAIHAKIMGKLLAEAGA